MATILNADTSTGGLIATGDSSGDLELQADGTTKVTVTSSGAAITGLNATGMQANGLTYPTSDGTADQVLTTNGSGTLTFADAGGGAWNLVAEVTPSSSSTVELTGMDSTYVTYAIIGSDVLLSSDASITFTLKQGGSYVSGGYYTNRISQYSGSNTVSGEGAENQLSVRITESSPATNNFVMYIYNPSNASSRTAFDVAHVGSASGTAYRTSTVGTQNTAGAVTAILFDCGSANFSSGSFKLYGIGG